MRILILEDEIPAKKKLIHHLNIYFGESAILNSTRTVKGGIELLENNNDYNLIVADIKLLDGTSFEVFRVVETQAPIIFCTAYNEHLLEAFQTNGIAYILKPYKEKDLQIALEKFEKLFKPKSVQKDVFEKLQDVLNRKGESYKKRFTIKKRDGIKLLDTSQITLIQANGDFCKIYDAAGNLHSISKSIGTLIQELNPSSFFKINRSQIINVDYIENMNPYSKNRLSLNIKGVKEALITSSTSTKEFRQWLEG